MSEIYERLKDKIDHLGFGLNADHEADLNFLKAFFTEEDAEYALAMSMDKFDTSEEMAERLGKDAAEVEEHLADMGERGLIFFKREGEKKKYRLYCVVLGILEFAQMTAKPEQLMTIGALMDNKTYSTYMWGTKTPEFYYIPVNSELVADNKVLPRDDAMKVLDAKDPNRIAISLCACRSAAKGQGTPCKHVGFDETCMWFDDFADYFVERGAARYITKEYAAEMMMKAEKEGLLLETTGTTAEGICCICMCCSCCCKPLELLRTNYATSEGIHMASNYYLEKDSAKCVNCGVCVDRCPMNAMSTTEDGVCMHDPARCIGCGICVSTCPGGALTLRRKPDEQLNPVDSKDIYELHDRIQKEYRARVAAEAEQ